MYVQVFDFLDRRLADRPRDGPSGNELVASLALESAQQLGVSGPRHVAARVEQAFEAGLERGLGGRLRDDGEMRLAVRQEGLGDLDVRVTVRESGVHASIGTQHDEARQLLNSQRADLEAALQRYNLRLDSFNVDVGHPDGRSGMRHEDAQDPSRHGEPQLSVRRADPAVAAAPNPHRAGGLSIRA